jgi:hypothetical protein
MYKRMLDFNIITINKINFNLKRQRKKEFHIIKHDNNVITFYAKDTVVTYHKYANSYGIKINDQIKKLIEEIENKFIKYNNITENQFNKTVKTNDKGNNIFVTTRKRGGKFVTEYYNEDKEPIMHDNIEVNDKVKCLISIEQVYCDKNNNYGLNIYVEKIYKMR